MVYSLYNVLFHRKVRRTVSMYEPRTSDQPTDTQPASHSNEDLPTNDTNDTNDTTDAQEPSEKDVEDTEIEDETATKTKTQILLENKYKIQGIPEILEEIEWVRKSDGEFKRRSLISPETDSEADTKRELEEADAAQKKEEQAEKEKEKVDAKEEQAVKEKGKVDASPKEVKKEVKNDADDWVMVDMSSVPPVPPPEVNTMIEGKKEITESEPKEKKTPLMKLKRQYSKSKTSKEEKRQEKFYVSNRYKDASRNIARSESKEERKVKRKDSKQEKEDPKIKRKDSKAEKEEEIKMKRKDSNAGKEKAKSPKPTKKEKQSPKLSKKDSKRDKKMKENEMDNNNKEDIHSAFSKDQQQVEHEFRRGSYEARSLPRKNSQPDSSHFGVTTIPVANVSTQDHPAPSHRNVVPDTAAKYNEPQYTQTVPRNVGSAKKAAPMRDRSASQTEAPYIHRGSMRGGADNASVNSSLSVKSNASMPDHSITSLNNHSYMRSYSSQSQNPQTTGGYQAPGIYVNIYGTVGGSSLSDRARPAPASAAFPTAKGQSTLPHFKATTNQPYKPTPSASQQNTLRQNH